MNLLSLLKLLTEWNPEIIQTPFLFKTYPLLNISEPITYKLHYKKKLLSIPLDFLGFALKTRHNASMLWVQKGMS